MNRLVSKGISNTYLKLPFEKNWRFQNSDFLSFLRKSSPRKFRGSSTSHRYLWVLRLPVIFCNVCFAKGNVFNICFISMYSVVNNFSEKTNLYFHYVKETLLHTLFLLRSRSNDFNKPFPAFVGNRWYQSTFVQTGKNTVKYACITVCIYLYQYKIHI